jgi:hypothetical protein
MPSDYAKAEYQRRYAGTILIGDVEVARTIQCVHCMEHWVPMKGSGRQRGWCMKCNGPVCGPKCVECRPKEVQLLIMEGKIDPNSIPVTVNVPAEVPK